MTIFLTLAALAPALALCVYIFFKDRSEKEPIGLLLLLLLMGALSCAPTILFEQIIGGILLAIFGGFITFSEDSTACITLMDYVYQFFNAFVGVALVEEFFKWLFMLWVTKKSRHFNSLFDGMVYAVFVSLGFAALENILYVFDGGISVALLRMVTAVPAHMFFGVFMGFWYSIWNINHKANRYKAYLVEKHNYHDKFNPFITRKPFALSLITPVLVHGLYDFLLFTGNGFLALVFIGVVIALYIYCFIKIAKFSKKDRNDMELAQAAVFNMYPDLAELERQSMLNPEHEPVGSSTPLD